MSSNDLFLETLKEIGYHEVDSLDDDSNLESVLSVKELGSFFEVFCTLNEKNVLTTEEIEEYSALTPAEVAKIEICDKNGQLQEDAIKYEKKKEVLFLQEHLTQIENHNKLIERQIGLFKKQEEELLEEKEIQQKLLLNAKKRFQTYDMSKLPLVQEKFISYLKYILEVSQDLQSLITCSDASDSKLPTSNCFKDMVHQYLDSEEKVFQSVNAYIQKKCQLQENGSLSFITNENAHRQELIKEAAYLQKALKRSIEDKVLTEKEIINIESMVKYFEAVKTSDFNFHSSQLKCKLEETLKFNEQLKKKEQELHAYALNAGSKYIDTVLIEIDLCASKETLNNLQFYIEELSLPINILICQRARLEILDFSLREHKQELHAIKDLLQEVLNEMKQQKLNLEERKILMESKVVTLKNFESHHETAILSSLYKILAISEDLEDSNISKVSISDVVQRANKLCEAEENCIRKSNEKIKTVDLIEKHVDCMESLLNCIGKEYLNWHELEQEHNINLNNLCIKLKSLEESASECSQDLDQKQKVLERKGNLRLARKLYIYALLNKDIFRKCIDDIKIAIENSGD